MAEPNKQTVQDLYDQAISQGIPEAEVINHISQFETPEHKSFLAQYHTNKAKEFGSVQKEPDMIDELVGAAKQHPGVAATAAVLPVAYYGAKAGIDYITDIAKQKAINALAPSEAVKVQRDDLIFKEKQSALEQAKNKEALEHQAELRRIELAKQNEQLTREQLQTQQLQSKAGVAPTAPATNVAPPTSTAPVTLPNAQATTPVATTSTPQEMANFATGVNPQKQTSLNGSPAPFAVPPQVNSSSNPTGSINVGAMPEGGAPAPFASIPPSPSQQALKAEITPPTNNNPTSAIATTEPNPVVSGEGTSPLHNPAGQGLTQVEATSASATPNAAFPAETNTTKESGNLTNPAENPTQGGVEQVKKQVKGAVVPRRSKQETQIANEEMPFNKYYNQVANRLAGTENLKEHPHITEQFDKAWEDVFHNVLGGKMEKSQGGAPAKIHEIEAHINANPEKYPDLVKYMSEAKQYAKGNINPKEGGFSHIGAMLGMLGAGGLGAYMVNRYGNPFQESMKKANEAMGEATGTQDLGKANKAEELSPAMRAIFTKASNPVYRKEINQQLATEKNPERIKELKRELEKAK